jgi:hypothetical protein
MNYHHRGRESQVVTVLHLSNSGIVVSKFIKTWLYVYVFHVYVILFR